MFNHETLLSLDELTTLAHMNSTMRAELSACQPAFKVSSVNGEHELFRKPSKLSDLTQLKGVVHSTLLYTFCFRYLWHQAAPLYSSPFLKLSSNSILCQLLCFPQKAKFTSFWLIEKKKLDSFLLFNLQVNRVVVLYCAELETCELFSKQCSLRHNKWHNSV